MDNIIKIHTIDDLLNLPKNVTKIYFNEFSESLDNVIFPDSLKKIYFDFHFNKPLTNCTFPDDIEIYLHVYNEIIIDSLPINLQYLEIQLLHIPVINLPSTLKELKITRDANKSLSRSKIPYGTKVILSDYPEVYTYPFTVSL